MPDQIVTRLQAMYHSGQVSAFIVSKFPTGTLPTGWIEQGLIGKGFAGNIQEREIQEDIIIPVDRFVRLFSESGLDLDYGMFILGGLTKSKLLTAVSNLGNKDPESMNVFGLNSENLQTSELLDIAGRFLMQEPDSQQEDPNLDYIEEFLSEVANGNVTQLLSLSLLPGKQKTVSWLKKILKTDLTSEVILAKSNNPQEFSSTILLLSRWLLGLDLFKKTENAISTILLVRGNEVLLCFWNSSQKIATFAAVEGFSIGSVLRKFVLPLWYTSKQDSKDDSVGPKVVIGKTKTKPPRTQIKAPPASSDSQSISIVRTRLTELNTRLTPVISSVNGIEKRISILTKDTRFQSMGEHSDNAIEELRRIEKDTKVLEDISTRLRKMEKQLEKAGSSLSPDEIQQIVTKMTLLRNMIDKIEVEMSQLDSRVSEIESLKFKRRSEN
ncbi:MAG: hypothetical protein ACTSSE_03540 [Candidatus Thorarchaeota archaeon]